MPKPNKITFRVVGARPFPMDMLRYDACYPATSDDAAEIATSLDRYDERFEIKLVSWHPMVVERGPTCGRWSSFLWSVDPDSIIKERS